MPVPVDLPPPTDTKPTSGRKGYQQHTDNCTREQSQTRRQNVKKSAARIQIASTPFYYFIIACSSASRSHHPTHRNSNQYRVVMDSSDDDGGNATPAKKSCKRPTPPKADAEHAAGGIFGGQPKRIGDSSRPLPAVVYRQTPTIQGHPPLRSSRYSE